MTGLLGVVEVVEGKDYFLRSLMQQSLEEVEQREISMLGCQDEAGSRLGIVGKEGRCDRGVRDEEKSG